MRIDEMTVLHRRQPIGIDERPYFSWTLTSEQRNDFQAAYRLMVSDEQGNSCWDSGLVKSRQSTFVVYQGVPLASKTRYGVRLVVWSSEQETAEAETTFETGLYRADWRAAWCVDPTAHAPITEKPGESIPSTLFRMRFQTRGVVEKARLYATCHGVYQAFLNGQRCDDREFAPEYTVYGHTLYYQTYDVTALLLQGENCLGFHVGDGWYLGAQTRINGDGSSGQHAILCQLHLWYCDGREEVVQSGEAMLFHSGPVVYSNLFHGETYDAAREIPNWCGPEPVSPDAGWEHAQRGNFGYDDLIAQPTDPVRPVKRLDPVAQRVLEDGGILYDLGQVFAGRVRLELDEPAGVAVTVRHYETLDENGAPFLNFDRDARQLITYRAAGGKCRYEPLFAFQGFRYAAVSGLQNPDRISVTGVALSSEKENLSEFSCSDQRLCRLVENARWSQRSNTISIPTDCPQREKAGWTGDINVYAPTAIVQEDMTAFLTAWLRNLDADQTPDGQIPCVSPLSDKYRKALGLLSRVFDGRKGEVTSAGWGDAIVTVPYEMYRLTGNRLILEEQYEAMTKWLAYVQKTAETRRGKGRIPKEDDRYLWNRGFHWGEWFIPDAVRKNVLLGLYRSIHTGKTYVAPAFYYRSAACMAEIAEILGKDGDARRYGELAEHIRKAYQNQVIRPDGSFAVETQGAYVFGLAFGLVPDHLTAKAAGHLAAMIRGNGNRLNTGFLATPFLLDVLTEHGYEDLAHDLLYQTRCPSWLYEVERGATSIWESWNAVEEDGKPSASLSMNHYAFGCVASYIYRNLAGLTPMEPGFRRFRIRPRPDGRLRFCSYRYRSEYGWIDIHWKIREGVFTLRAAIPVNTRAEIVLPDGTEIKTGSGSYQWTCAYKNCNI